MIKKYLVEYRSLRKEIEDFECELRNDYQHDKVMGSSSQFPYTRRTFSVKGLKDNRRNDERLARLNALRLQKKKVDKFISEIPDRITKRIFILKYIEGENKRSWAEVAEEIGGGNTADGVRMCVNYYLKKQKNKYSLIW